MKFQYTSAVFGLILLSLNINAQSLAELTNGKHGRFYENSHWGFALNFANMSNPDAPYSDEHKQSGFTLKIDYKRYGSDRGDKRVFYQNKSIGDFLFILT